MKIRSRGNRTGRYGTACVTAAGHEASCASPGTAAAGRGPVDGRTAGVDQGDHGSDLVVNLAGRSASCRYTPAT